MEKRGQVYLIAAIVICLILFILLSGSNIFTRIFVQDRFSDIAKNYEIESSKYINEIVKSGDDDVGDELKDFTETFIQKYSNNIDSSVGMLYVFSHKDGFWVFNYLAEQEGEENIIINYGGGLEPSEPNVLDGVYSCAHKTESCSGFGSCITIPLGDFASCALEFTGKGELDLQIGDINYGPFPNNDVENPTLVFIFKKAKENTVKVFINDKNEGRGRNSEESED